MNDSTLAGVDVNANGVRDDVERYIARNTSSKEDFNIAISYGRFLCQLSSFPTTGTIEDVAGVANIVTSTNNADIDRLKNKLSPEFFANLSKKILNTKDRDARYNKVSSFMFNPESAVEAKKCIPASTVFDISIPPEPNIAENNDTIL